MADYGKTARCCQVLTTEELNELAEEGRPLDCGVCDYGTRQDALWPQNAEAWSIYRSLCGRTVGMLELHGWLFLALTSDLSTTDRQDVLARLDVIHAVLSPEARTGRGDDARGAETRHHD